MDITSCVKYPPITLINMEQVGVKKESDYIKVKIFRNPASATSEIYKAKLALFENRELEEFVLFICDFRKAPEAMGVT